MVMKIGVLALQGAVREHIKMIEECGVTGVPVKKVEELAELNGLILPGGESTTMRRLMDRYGFTEKLKNSNLPMFGTCAGLILLGEDHLNKINMSVRRNSFGRQVDSFEAELAVKGIDETATAVFIRAPHIEAVAEDVDVLSEVEGKIVAVKNDRHLGISFHPELTESRVFHQYFVNMVQNMKNMDSVTAQSK